MTGHYLAEFSCSYKPVKHGRPGVCIHPHIFPPTVLTALIALLDWCDTL